MHTETSQASQLVVYLYVFRVTFSFAFARNIYSTMQRTNYPFDSAKTHPCTLELEGPLGKFKKVGVHLNDCLRQIEPLRFFGGSDHIYALFLGGNNNPKYTY